MATGIHDHLHSMAKSIVVFVGDQNWFLVKRHMMRTSSHDSTASTMVVKFQSPTPPLGLETETEASRGNKQKPVFYS